jgi:hypothetical protein
LGFADSAVRAFLELRAISAEFQVAKAAFLGFLDSDEVEEFDGQVLEVAMKISEWVLERGDQWRRENDRVRRQAALMGARAMRERLAQKSPSRAPLSQASVASAPAVERAVVDDDNNNNSKAKALGPGGDPRLTTPLFIPSGSDGGETEKGESDKADDDDDEPLPRQASVEPKVAKKVVFDAQDPSKRILADVVKPADESATPVSSAGVKVRRGIDFLCSFH